MSWPPSPRLTRRAARARPPPAVARLDHVRLAPDHMDQVPDDVQQRLVRLLDAVDAEARDGEAVVAELGHPAAVAPGEPDGQHANLSGRLERPVDVGRLAAG